MTRYAGPRRAVRRTTLASGGQAERDFQKQVLNLLQWRGWLLRYHTWRSDHSPSGFPDIIAVRAPRIVALEIKSEEGIVSPAQRAWLDAFAQCPGVTAFVVRPSEWALLDALLA